MFQDMKLTDIAKLDGVKDLPPMVKGFFAKALKAEAKGDRDAADKFLEMALSN